MKSSTLNVSELNNKLSISSEKLEANLNASDKNFFPSFTQLLFNNLLSPIEKYWFRSQLINFNSYPQRENPEIPIIFITNHSGMAFPWDAITFSTKITQHFNLHPAKLRALVSPYLTKNLFMSPFLVPGLWEKTGSLSATLLNFETLMFAKKSDILIYPEGLEGISKGFNNRYKIQELKTSFLRMSIKYKADIIPIATVNAEFINPLAYRWKTLNKIVQKLGLPFLPLAITTFLAILQPWLFYIALPANLHFVKGEPIKPYNLINKPIEQISQHDLKQLAQKIKLQMQNELDIAVAAYGKKPYNFKILFVTLIKNIKQFFKYFPLFWCFNFNYADKEYFKKKNNIYLKISFLGYLKVIISRPWIIALFLPLVGWLIIFYKNKLKNLKLKKNSKQL